MLREKNTLDEVYEYFLNKAPDLFFVLSREGGIVDANQYANTIAGRNLVGENIRGLIVDFTGKFDLNVLINDTTEHLLNINTASGLPQSFYFSFKPSPITSWLSEGWTPTKLKTCKKKCCL